MARKQQKEFENSKNTETVKTSVKRESTSKQSNESKQVNDTKEVLETNKPVNEKHNTSPSSIMEKIKTSKDIVSDLNDIKDSVENDVIVQMVTFVIDYINKMEPGKNLIPNKAAYTQYSFYIIIKAIMESEYETFIMGIGILLGVFNKLSNGVFGPYYVYRFLDKWPGNSEERRAFMQLIDLISLFANTDREIAKKQFNIEKFVNDNVKTISKTGIDNINKFYNI